MADVWCGVCRRREPTYGNVCDFDRDRIRRQLAGLPTKLAALTHFLIPGKAPQAERVAVSRVDAPLPVHVDTLSLVGPGCEDVEWAPALQVLHPAVRRWQTVQTVWVDWPVAPGKTVRVERRIIDWHQELARDAAGYPLPMVSDHDQVGVRPPAEWLDSWARAFRRHFGHGVPPRTLRVVADPDGPRAALLAAAADPRMHAMLGQLHAVGQAWREHCASVVLGLSYGHGGTVPAGERPDDPLADEWEVRFGAPARYQAFAGDVKYLLAWLEAACEDDGVDVARMAAELRAVTAELTRVLGEQPDEVWLGRCPTTLTDHESNTSQPCGAGLWQDPAASVIECPRCHCTWGPKVVEQISLAREIRRVWPIDRRKRYTRGDREGLTPPACPSCARRVVVTWRDVTATGDKMRWWQPAAIKCTGGCSDAARVA